MNPQTIITADGSYTMLGTSIYAQELAEPMHSRAGALGETFYVYGAVVDELLRRQWPLRILSVGLGLAYNEMMTVAKVLSQDPDQISELYIESYEVDAQLREDFDAWLCGRPNPVYYQILSSIADTCGIEAKVLFHVLGKLRDVQQIQVLRRLSASSKVLTAATGVFYDPFSTRVNPELWDSEFLRCILAQLQDPNVFASYSATSTLKKCLADYAYEASNRRGFGNKRECTLAIRETELGAKT